MRKFAIDLAIVVVVLVVIYAVILHIMPNFGRTIFSSLLRQPSVEVFYFTHTEADTHYVEVPMPPVTVPADTVYIEAETGDIIQEYSWMPEHQYLRGWVHVEVNTVQAEATFSERNLEVAHIETTHWHTEVREITLPPPLIRSKIGAAYGIKDDGAAFGVGGGIMLFNKLDILVDVDTDRTIWARSYYTF